MQNRSEKKEKNDSHLTKLAKKAASTLASLFNGEKNRKKEEKKKIKSKKKGKKKIDNPLYYNYTHRSFTSNSMILTDIAKMSTSSQNIPKTVSEIQTKAASHIQRLWRGYRVRKEVTLTLPSILNYTNRLRLWKISPASSIPLQEIENKLLAIHATDFFPENGMITVVDPKKRGGGSYFRPTTHFALGELVRPQCEGKISREYKKFAIITPLKDLLPQLLNINVYDTFILGHFKLTKGSIVLVPIEELKRYQSAYPKLNILSYSPEEGLRQATKRLVIEHDGYDIVTYNNDDKYGINAPALCPQFGYLNINTPDFFAPILQNRRKVAFGAHSTSLFGHSYFLGIADNALTQLGFSPEYYYGYTYNEDPAFAKVMIEYSLERIKSNSTNQKHHSSLDVLTLHIKRAREGIQKLAVSGERRSFSGDYYKARIAIYLAWPDLHALMQTKKSLALYNQAAFLCMYAYYRTHRIGQKASGMEGLDIVFKHNLGLMPDRLYIQVVGYILSIQSNQSDKTIFPGGFSCFQNLMDRLVKKYEIPTNSTDTLEIKIDTIWKNLNKRQYMRTPQQLDTPDSVGNVPIIQALISRDEKKALDLLYGGANITNVSGRIAGWDITIPLLSVAIRFSMFIFALELLKRPDFTAWDQLDGWSHTPLCDAIMMGAGDVALHLIKRGARTDIRPNYTDMVEQDLVSLANRTGLSHVSSLLQEYSASKDRPKFA